MRLYHGTAAKFDDFDLGKSRKDYGPGAYFTADKDQAKGYAEDAMSRSGASGPRVVEKEVNQASLLNLRSGEITESTVKIAARRLGKTLDERAVKEIAGAAPGDKIGKLREHLGSDAPALLAEKCGKVGFVTTSVNKEEGDVFVVASEKYLNDPAYAKKVNRHGATPGFVRKMNKTLGEVQRLDSMSDDLAKKSKVFTSRDALTKSYLKAVTQLSDELPINVTKMKASLKRIDEGAGRGWTPERSVKQGVRLALIDDSKKKTHGKLCRMLGTSAEEPDLEHSLLEGEVMPCEEVLQHLQRFGCQHNFEILE